MKATHTVAEGFMVLLPSVDMISPIMPSPPQVNAGGEIIGPETFTLYWHMLSQATPVQISFLEREAADKAYADFVAAWEAWHGQV